MFMSDDLTDEPGFAAAPALGGTDPCRRKAAEPAWCGRGSRAGPARKRRAPRHLIDLDLWPIGNCHVNALVNRARRFVWGCLPRVRDIEH